MILKAIDLRPGDHIVRNKNHYIIKATDNVDGFIEVVTEDGSMFYARWSKEFVVIKAPRSVDEQPF